MVDQIFELMRSNTTLNISIEGHTDNSGDPASNKKLSNDRAKAVMDALIQKELRKQEFRLLAGDRKNLLLITGPKKEEPKTEGWK